MVASIFFPFLHSRLEAYGNLKVNADCCSLCPPGLPNSSEAPGQGSVVVAGLGDPKQKPGMLCQGSGFEVWRFGISVKGVVDILGSWMRVCSFEYEFWVCSVVG